MNVGLRVDVDTWHGTRLGVPALCRLLAARGITASFFFSVGPDNMGRHLWRLFRPAFLWKMLRSRAASLYGWSILLRGTLWPGPIIGKRLAATIRGAAQAGHEIGLHAWDHHAWQSHIAAMSEAQVRKVTGMGVESLAAITGAHPTCAAAPGWRYSGAALRAQTEFPFAYQSDCRGESIFLPAIDGGVLDRPQIPVTLPTYDEVIGRDGATDADYNDRLLARLGRSRLAVLAVHAEVEGITRAALFADFLDRALAAGWRFVPLGSLLADRAELPVARIVAGSVPGRDGPVACQGPSEGLRPWRARPGPVAGAPAGRPPVAARQAAGGAVPKPRA